MAMTLRTDEALQNALRALAQHEGVSQQEIVRRAVLERFESRRHADQVRASSQRMLERWGVGLERLSPT
jgi:hypothetical protein